jgi:heme exporter protein B
MSALILLFRREFGLAWGRGGGAVLALAFFASITALTPLTVGSEPERLAALAIGSSWLALALSNLLSLERMFERDFEDGALDQLALGPVGLVGVCAVKALAQWVAVGLPLAVAAPIAAAALGAPDAVLLLALGAAVIGGLGFAFTGMMGAALALGSRRGGLLIAVVVLPLFAPPAIFGAGTLAAAAQGLPWAGGLALIAAWTLFSAAISPMVAAFSVRDALG